MKNIWAIVATIMFAALIFVVGTWIGAYGPIWKAIWTAQPADWLGFLGNIIAGLMTLGAAGIALLAVKTQIASDREIAQQSHIQAMRAIKQRLKPLLEAIGVLWTILDETLAFVGTDEEKLSRTTWLQTTLYSLPPETIVSDIREIADHIARDRAQNFDLVLLRISLLYKNMTRYSEQVERADELTWRMHDIRMIRLQIALLQHAIKAFEPAWAATFGDHPEVLLDDTSYADVMRGIRQLWAEEETRRRLDRV